MANKSVLQFNEVSAISGANLFHLVVGNVDKKIQWTNVVDQIDTDLSITSTFGSIATQISTINSTISTNDSNAVHKTGDETVGGVKTFSLSPTVPNPTNNTDAANKQWVLSVVGSSGIDGTLTAGKYPVAIDSNTVGDGRIRQTDYTLYIESPDTTQMIVVEDAGIQLFSTQGFFELTDTTLRFGHNLSLIIQGNNIQLDNLTASTVPVLNASKKLESSAVTTTVLGYISTLSSNAQTQIDSLSSLIVGATNLRGSFTPSGSYPTTGGTGTSGAVKKGNFWIMSGISGSATMGGKTVQNGDAAIALVDTPGQTDANWLIQEGNFGFTPLNQAMTSGYVYIGNGSNIGTAVPLTGPVTVNNAGLTAIGTGAITDAMLASSFVKADGTTPLTADWYAGPYKIITDSVTIGDPIESIQVVGINGGTIYSEGDGLKLYSGGRGIVLDAETAAIDIIKGFIKCEPGKGLGNMFVSDVNGVMTLQKPFIYTLPGLIYDTADTDSTETDVISVSIPANTLLNQYDKIIIHFSFLVSSGTTGSVRFGAKINSVVTPGFIDYTISSGGETISGILTLERRSTNRIYSQLEIKQNGGAPFVAGAADVSTSYNFANAIPISLYSNRKTTTRTVDGHFGNAVYYKAN